MLKISYPQYEILVAAAQRPAGSLLPYPMILRDHTEVRMRRDVLDLIKAGLAVESEDQNLRSFRLSGAISVGVVITDAGRAVIADPAERQATSQSLVHDFMADGQGRTVGEIAAGVGLSARVIRSALKGLSAKGFGLNTDVTGRQKRYGLC